MAEYMDYNDVEIGYKSKRHKIFSTIRFYIAVAFLLFVVIWTFTHLPENVRTNFESVVSSAHKIGEKKTKTSNDFIMFDADFEVDEKQAVDKDFKDSYRRIYELTQVSKLDLAKDKIDTFNLGNTFVVVRTYEVERQKDANGNYYDENMKTIVGTLGFDVCIFEYDTEEVFTIKKPQRFSFRYHNKVNDLTPTIEKVYVESESFRLNFYSLSVVVESETEFNGVKTTLNLQEGINKKEYEKQTFVKTQFAKSKEQKDLIKTYFAENTERGDKKITTTFNIQNTNYAEVGIEFDDALYNKFESFKIDEIKNATYKIKVN